MRILQTRFSFDNGTATIELNAGVIETYRQITQLADSDSAAFIWRGGTFRAGVLRGTWQSFKYSEIFKPGASGISVSIEGPDCTLDLSEFPNMSITNTAGTSEWVGKPGAVLKVVSSKAVPGMFAMRNLALNGLALDLNGSGGSAVELLESTGNHDVVWVTPGTNGCLKAVNADPATAPSLTASYHAPSGTVFETAFTEGWNCGFSSVIQKDLTFGSEAVCLARTTSGGVIPALNLTGSVTLPTSLYFVIDTSAGRLSPGPFTLIAPECGAVGDCVFAPTPNCNATTRHSTLSVASGGILSGVYEPNGMMLIFR